MSEALEAAIEAAAGIAVKYKTGEIGTEQLLYGLSKADSIAKTILNECGVTAAKIESLLERNAGNSPEQEPEFTTRVQNVLIAAHNTATALHAEQIESEHVLNALLKESSSVAVAYLVKGFGVNLRELASALQREMGGAPAGQQQPQSIFDLFSALSGGAPAGMNMPPQGKSGTAELPQIPRRRTGL